ncbi:hypothetical protein ED733_003010 [Metarhizium rileyi]|uniref:Uncharacterized protein n=1 Tax=Metarhizium rileyi (strain RCEF 4871) TaxID=1649241 RepID=A0A5C6GEI2_METRR|nr:hypothetical protein ED733_003010 [Metarhizium rileyi]
MNMKLLALFSLATAILAGREHTAPSTDRAIRPPRADEKAKAGEWWEAPRLHLETVTMTPQLAHALNKMRAAPDWPRLRVDANNKNKNNTMRGPEFCSYIRGLAWMTTTSLKDIDSLAGQDESTILGQVPEQKGSLVRLLRTMILWEKFLSVLEIQLWESPPPEQEAQVRMAHCYTDYTLKTQQWLRRLEQQAHRFSSPGSKARCMVYSRLNLLYRQYADVAMRLYARASFRVPLYRAEQLLDASFPRETPSWWNPTFEAPEPNTPIRRYLLRRENVYIPRYRHTRFEEAIRAWECASSDDAHGQTDKESMLAEMRLAEKIAILHALSRQDKIDLFYDAIEQPILARYAAEMDKMSANLRNRTTS